MFGSQSIVCLATLVLGASALVMDSLHQRNGLTTAHRRHAANVLDASVHPAKRTIAERRALRQKRCAQRNNTLSSSSVVATVSADNVPQNFAPDPTTTTPEADQQQPQPTPNTDNGSDNSNGNTGSGNGNTGGGGDTYTGDLTYYDAGLGACGGTNTNSDMIAAVGWQFFDSFGGGYTNPNNAPICNKPVVITYGGKSITVTIVDRCGGCQPDDLDLTPTAFSQLADLGVGRLHGATWHFA